MKTLNTFSKQIIDNNFVKYFKTLLITCINNLYWRLLGWAAEAGRIQTLVSGDDLCNSEPSWAAFIGSTTVNRGNTCTEALEHQGRGAVYIIYWCWITSYKK